APARLAIERMTLVHNGTRIEVKEGEPVRIRTASGTTLETGESHFDTVETGIKISSNSVAVGTGRVIGRISVKFDKVGTAIVGGGNDPSTVLASQTPRIPLETENEDSLVSDTVTF